MKMFVKKEHFDAGKFADGSPAFTRVTMTLKPSPVSNIRCELWMPEKEAWSGRLWGIGNTGYGGVIVTGAFMDIVKNGDCVVNTDMGTHQTLLMHPEVQLDYGHRSTHLMTVAAKEIIAETLGRAPDFSYFKGLSSGGGQGFHEVQRYPEDYDGVISEVPCHFRCAMQFYGVWLYQHSHTANGGQLFWDENFEAIKEATLEAFADTAPEWAVKNRCVADTHFSEEKLDKVMFCLKRRMPEFTDFQLDAIRAIFRGPTIDGVHLCDGAPFGCNLRQACFDAGMCLSWYFGPDVNLMKLDIATDLRKYVDAMAPVWDAVNPDVNGFVSRGGKWIVYCGFEDGLIPFHFTEAYFKKAKEATPGIENAARFYLLPGRGHTAGTGVRYIRDGEKSVEQMLIDWREKQIVPSDPITGFNTSNAQLTLPLKNRL